MYKVWDSRGSTFLLVLTVSLPSLTLAELRVSKSTDLISVEMSSNSLSKMGTLFQSLWIHLNADEGTVSIAVDFLHSDTQSERTHCYLVTKVVVTDDQYLLEPHTVNFIKLSGKLITSLISM